MMRQRLVPPFSYIVAGIHRIGGTGGCVKKVHFNIILDLDAKAKAKTKTKTKARQTSLSSSSSIGIGPRFKGRARRTKTTTTTRVRKQTPPFFFSISTARKSTFGTAHQRWSRSNQEKKAKNSLGVAVSVGVNNCSVLPHEVKPPFVHSSLPLHFPSSIYLARIHISPLCHCGTPPPLLWEPRKTGKKGDPPGREEHILLKVEVGDSYWTQNALKKL